MPIDPKYYSNEGLEGGQTNFFFGKCLIVNLNDPFGPLIPATDPLTTY